MNITINRVLWLIPNGNLVQWSLSGANSSGTYTFSVYRSGSTDGPWALIADRVDGFCHLDRFDENGTTDSVYRRPNQLALHRVFYYKVVAFSPDGSQAQTVGSHVTGLDRLMARQWRKEVYDLEKMLKYNGRPAAVLKRRAWGQRCTKCTDAVLRDATRSTCKVCYGTGFNGGYWNAVRTLVRRHSEQRTSEDGAGPRSDGMGAQLLMPHAPLVEKSDVIVFLDDNARLRVEGFARPLVTKIPSRQVVVVSEVESSHILYTIRVDADGVGALV